MKTQAILIIAHGSKVKETDLIMEDYMAALRHADPEMHYEKCYLQLMSPALDEAVEKLYAIGIRRIKAFPFFLFNGNHIKEDIPMELDKLKSTYLDLEIDFLENIGFDEKLVEIILERVGRK